MLEVRVYFDGLIAFAPDPADKSEAKDWLAILATAPASTNTPNLVPHTPDVWFSANTTEVGARPGAQPSIDIKGQSLTVSFGDPAKDTKAPFGREGTPVHTRGKRPVNPGQAKSFYWTPNMADVTGSSDQGELDEKWASNDYVNSAVRLDGGLLSTAALVTSTCNTEGPVAIVDFGLSSEWGPRAMAEILVWTFETEMAESTVVPEVWLTTTPLDGSPGKQTLKLTTKPDGDDKFVMSIRIRNLPNAVRDSCEEGGSRTSGQHFATFGKLAKVDSDFYPRRPSPANRKAQPAVYKAFLGTNWGNRPETVRFPPICPPVVMQ